MGVDYQYFAKHFEKHAVALIDYLREWKLDDGDDDMKAIISNIEYMTFKMKHQELINNPK